MSDKLLISNCENSDYQFIINSDIETPVVIATGETELVLQTGVDTLCLVVRMTDCSPELVNAQIFGEYNGQPVYYFVATECNEPPEGFYVVWSTANSRWEVWTDYDSVTGPSCDIDRGCCEANEPLHYLTNTLTETNPVTIEGEVEWVSTAEPGCFSTLTEILVTGYCPEEITITDFVDCWTAIPVPPGTEGLGTLVLTPTQLFSSCEECIGTTPVVEATNCVDNTVIYIEQTEDYDGGLVVSLDMEYEGVNCWTLNLVDEAEGEVLSIEISTTFEDCEACNPTPPLPINCDLPTLYRLEDCLGRGKVMHTREDLSEYIGQIIRSEYYDECFRVYEEEESTEQNYTLNFEVDSVHTNCFDCLPKKPVEPWVNEQCCDEETVQEVVCNYSDGIYKQIVSRRFGIKTIENSDITNNEIRFEALRNKLLCLPYPPLPEPIVREECLTIEQPCIQVQNDCHGCTEPSTIEDNPCEACANSEHDCHTYIIRQQGQIFQQASGNTNEWLNGRILFGYFPCGKTESVTVSFTESFNGVYCVLGVPILGYYRNNTFVTLPTTRGEQCEAPEENDCCNGNNNQNTDQNQNVEQNNT